MSASTEDSEGRVVVTSTRQLLLPTNTSYLQEFELHTEVHSVSRGPSDGEPRQWRGVKIEALLSRVEAGDRWTHLLVTGSDGYRACVSLDTAFDALLAVERPDVQQEPTLPRFVGAELDGTESVASVDRIETIKLDPDESASEYASRPTTDS